MTEMKDELIHEMKVVEQHGREIGSVEEVFVDTDTWKIAHLSIKLSRDALEDLHLRKPLFGTQTIRISSSELSGARDVIVLKRKLEDLEFEGGVRSNKSWGSVLISSHSDEEQASES